MNAVGWTLPSGAPRVIGEWIEHKAERNGAKVALEIVGRTKTYEGVERDSGRLAAGYARLGLGVGDNVALMMKNSLENVDAWFAMCRAGIVEVPINQANRGYLLEYLIAQSRSQAIVVDEELLDRVAEVAPRLPGLRHVVVHRETGAGTPSFPEWTTVHELADLYLDEAPPRPALDRTARSVILYTSGTTGPSKGVCLSHEANLNLTRHTCWLVGYGSDDVLYTAFPLFHVNAKYTSVMCAMEADAALVMDQRFSASQFWDLCRAKGITAFNYQGGLLMMLWKQPPRADDAANPVRRGFGAPCPVEIWEPFEERFGVQLVEVFGSTEVAIATENPIGARKIGTAGRESANYQVRVVDEHDQPVPPDTPGEIVVRPKKPSIMIERYFDMPEATVKAFRGLWFHTGDRGRIDADGYLTFVDRMKDCVRRRGENISSFEVEAVVNTHEAVLESAVFGVASEIGEEEVMVAVVRKEGYALTEVELLDFCTERMAHFAVPRFVRWMAELPKTPSQRVRKFQLREEGVTGDTWDREAHGYKVRR